MDVTFLAVAEEDAESLVAIDRACFSEVDAYSEDEMLYFLRLPFCTGEKAIIGDVMAGFLLHSEGHIITIDVIKEFRRRGIGTMLLRRALKEMERADTVNAFLEVDRDNHSALRLYRNEGFETISRFQERGKIRYLMCRQLRT